MLNGMWVQGLRVGKTEAQNEKRMGNEMEDYPGAVNM